MPEHTAIYHKQINKECKQYDQEYRGQAPENEFDRNPGYANYSEHCNGSNQEAPEIVHDKKLDDKQQCCYYLRSGIKSVNW